jgi:hypothetical protein
LLQALLWDLALEHDVQGGWPIVTAAAKYAAIYCILPQALVWDLALERDPEEEASLAPEALLTLYVDIFNGSATDTFTTMPQALVWDLALERDPQGRYPIHPQDFASSTITDAVTNMLQALVWDLVTPRRLSQQLQSFSQQQCVTDAVTFVTTHAATGAGVGPCAGA